MWVIDPLRPERSCEGADAPLIPLVRSTGYGHVTSYATPPYSKRTPGSTCCTRWPEKSGVLSRTVGLASAASL
jgi:hypothetical protein